MGGTGFTQDHCYTRLGCSPGQEPDPWEVPLSIRIRPKPGWWYPPGILSWKMETEFKASLSYI